MSVDETQEAGDLAYREDMPRIRTRDGVELYCEYSGAGTAITLLNNFFLTSPFWRACTQDLAQNYKVVAYDMCNHGASSHHEQEPTWDEHAADVIGLLDGLGIESTYLVGTSASTQLARDVALKYPDRVKGLILAGPVFGLTGLRRHRQLQKAWLVTLQNHGLFALYDHMYPEVISGQMNEDGGAPGFLGLRESLLAVNNIEELTNGLTLAGKGETDPALLGRIAAPTLIILGDDDILLSPTRGHELAKLFQDGRCEIIPNAGHVPFFDDPELFETLIRKFVDEAESRG
jgi:pimeloyl-ACP methyl ester carboxylesterase